MSAVLKSGSDALRAKVRPFEETVPTREPEPPRVDPEVERLRTALEVAEAAIVERDAVIAAIPARIKEAQAEGYDEGHRAAELREAERVQILDRAAEKALARFKDDLVALEKLAALLARTCLDRMLLNDEARVQTVSDLLHARLSVLEASAVIKIQVSADDFQSPEALAGIAPKSCEIIASPALGAGDCSIQLRLGTLEIGVNQQWGALRAELEEMVR